MWTQNGGSLLPPDESKKIVPSVPHEGSLPITCGEAVTFWLWFVPLIGPTAYFRFDLVPAVLAGGAVLALMRRPALCGVLTAIGAALKLWPAIIEKKDAPPDADEWKDVREKAHLLER